MLVQKYFDERGQDASGSVTSKSRESMSLWTIYDNVLKFVRTVNDDKGWLVPAISRFRPQGWLIRFVILPMKVCRSNLAVSLHAPDTICTGTCGIKCVPLSKAFGSYWILYWDDQPPSDLRAYHAQWSQWRVMAKELFSVLKNIKSCLMSISFLTIQLASTTNTVAVPKSAWWPSTIPSRKRGVNFSRVVFVRNMVQILIRTPAVSCVRIPWSARSRKHW